MRDESISAPLWNDMSISRFVSRYIPLRDTGYIAGDLELLTGSLYISTPWRSISLRREAREALENLGAGFYEVFGRPIVVVSGHRSAEYQKRLWDQGKCSDTLCAPPGYSEHQLGLAIDIFEATTEDDYLANRAFARYVAWLHDHAHEYGYHQSYQKWRYIDAYDVEPWHWRYLGVSLATRLRKLDMSYSEYVEMESLLAFLGMLEQ
jgi:LAS superfamily LD-carboxypeptidase LdcB